MHSDKTCRVCLSESNELTPLRARLPGKLKNLVETINFLVNINIVLERGLPNRICKDCKTLLDLADTFKQRVLKSEAILSQLDKRKDTDESRPSFVNKGPENREIYSDDASSLPTAVSKPPLSYTFEEKIENAENIYDLPEYKIKTEIDENYVGDEIATSEQKHSATAPSKSKQQLCIKEEVPVELVNYSDNKESVLEMSKHTQVLCYSCKECGRDFPSGESLESHRLEHRIDAPCPKNHNVDDPLIAEVKSATEEQDASNSSNTTTTETIAGSKADVKVNMRTKQSESINNTTTKILTCDICGYTTNNIKNLNSHLKAHAAKKTYSCDSCLYLTIHLKRLVVHKRTHTGDKPYCCDVCEKKFSIHSTLVRHLRTHTGDKPHCCDVCEKKFTDRSTFHRHVRIHTGDKPYCCDVCKNKFSDHTTFVRHKRKHTGDKPFSCYVCKKKFRLKFYLDNHVRTHTGDKPYSCHLCAKKFSQRGNLYTHLKTHTK